LSSQSGAKARFGVDIGGTFTDIVLTEPDGTIHVSKVSSTTYEPHRAVIDGMRDLLAASGVAPQAVGEIVHGNTVASNTILQRAGAATGLITTRGFRDVLEIGRIRTPEMFDLTWEKPVPLVRRRHRLEVTERIGADGAIVEPLDEAGLIAAAGQLVEAGIRSLAICFINSYVNPIHEQRAEELVRQHHPDVSLSVSSRILPEIKEYERTSTTVVNAYLRPVMERYLELLQTGVREIGIAAPLLVIASNGGVASAAATAEKPVFSVGSGPAAGVIGAARLGERQGYGNVIAFDMGGTTAKASLIEDGKVTLTTEYEFREGLSTSSRFIKAGGYMLKVPAIDIAEVGAGGGSIAHVDAGGLLHVGPQSAGAEPGPACYGLGGDAPTVTDASVAIGYLNPRYLAGGALEIDRDKALAAIRRDVAGPLGVDEIEAAHGIRAVANANMARALRSVSVERGRDPRDFVLMTFGGSGALHAVELARMLEIGEVVVPALPGVFTAVGMLASDVEHHLVRACSAPLAGLDHAAMQARLDELRAEAEETLAREGFGDGERQIAFAVDMRYRKQSLELTVPMPGDRFTDPVVAGLREGFVAAYATTYGYASDREEPEIVNLRAVASGTGRARLDFAASRVDAPPPAERAENRAVYFERGAPPVEVPVRDRDSVTEAPQAGPVILESYESTIVVPPGASVRRGAFDAIVIDPWGAADAD
jgi:N-methylhydantoinase A